MYVSMYISRTRQPLRFSRLLCATQFTCFTGTKVQILTQKAAERDGLYDSLACYVSRAGARRPHGAAPLHAASLQSALSKGQWGSMARC